MKNLYLNPYSFDAYLVEKDSQGRGVVNAKIMKAGRLKYKTSTGETFFGNISVEELEKAIPSAKSKPVTIKHPPSLLTPSDVMKYQEGVSADGYSIKEIDDEQWLVGPVILQSDKAIETAESGKIGVSAGYRRNAVPTGVDGEFDFKDIDINHIAIGCENPRAEGAGLSLDEAEEDSARIYSFAEQQTQKKKEVIMKQRLNAVKVGVFSLDEAPISYDEEGTGTENAIAVLVDRETKLVSHLGVVQESMDDAEEAHKVEVGELSGENKGLKATITEMEKEKENMISLDDVDARVTEMADIKAVASTHKIDTKFDTPMAGKRAIVEKVYPNQSFDDAEIDGAYKTIKVDEKHVKERMKSDEALKNKSSMDSGEKISLSEIDADELIKRKKNSKK